MADTSHPRVFTPTQAGQALGISRSAVYGLIDRGELEARLWPTAGREVRVRHRPGPGARSVVNDGGPSYRETFARGSIRPRRDRLPLLRGHDHDHVVGPVVSMQDDGEGFVITARLAETDAGREARELVADGALGSVSIGFRGEAHYEADDGTVTRQSVELVEISLVARVRVSWLRLPRTVPRLRTLHHAARAPTSSARPANCTFAVWLRPEQATDPPVACDRAIPADRSGSCSCSWG